MPSALRPELQAAIEAAQAAARIHVRYQGEQLVRGTKSNARDLVTQVDLESEDRIRQILLGAFPDDGFLGEETGAQAGASPQGGGRRWIVDPLDGTVNYVHGMPAYAVSIALEVHGVLELGVVLNSARDELFTALRGHGAFLNGAPLRTSACPVLDEAMVATGFAYTPERRAENLALFTKMLPQVRCVRRPGAASLDLAYVAAGRLDGFWELHLSPWDVAAGAVLVREAGGEVSSGDGPLDLDAPLIVASNGPLHGPLVRALQRRSGPPLLG